MATSPTNNAAAQRVLGVLAEVPTYGHEGAIHVPLHFGRVIDQLTPWFRRVVLCTPHVDGPPTPAADYQLRTRDVQIVPQPFHVSMLEALPRAAGMARAYARTCSQVDALFVRGLTSFSSLLYFNAWRHRCRMCHWLVGNPVALLRTHRRSSWLKDTLSLIYAWQAQSVTRWGRWLTDGVFVCNGRELADVYASPRTHATVSTALTDDEFHERSDTCRQPTIRILLVSYLRPEKGIEYLITAFARLESDRRLELHLVGPSDKYGDYRERLEQQVRALGLNDRVFWRGFVRFGPELFAELRAADLFVLPTLSEGTPRVLVEARAQSLPVVATNVGGIPTSVRHEHDGLLVPPRDPDALAAAMQRVITDTALRQALIRNGLATARALTVDRFAAQVVTWMGLEGSGGAP